MMYTKCTLISKTILWVAFESSHQEGNLLEIYWPEASQHANARHNRTPPEFLPVSVLTGRRCFGVVISVALEKHCAHMISSVL